MGLDLTLLWASPEINPITRKARSVPFLNPINTYGRVFFFSWFGFMVAFWAWYAFPPLLTVTIKADLGLTPAQVANSNIVSLVATLFVRAVAGPLCDEFGARKVFGGLLLLGAVPVGLAPLVKNANGLYAVRFFIGILGGSFVPCQVWSTAFFDKNVVGLANALTGGFGNAGGGITYFIMPAIYDSFVARGYTAGPAWRLTFLAPLIMVLLVGCALLLLCPDTPDGKWSDRELHAQQNLQAHLANNGGVIDVPGAITDKASSEGDQTLSSDEKKAAPADFDHEAQMTQEDMKETVEGEVIQKPSFSEAVQVAFSLQTTFHMLTYMCSFGSELAIDANLSNYYLKNFAYMGQTGSSNWAAMFGFLNFVTRPLGGYISDCVYNYCGKNLWLKKAWITTCGMITGALLIIIGKLNSHDQSTMVGLVALMAIFLEAGNGANFALVPHVHPFANGIVSGLTGAAGNLGGVLFAIVFRFVGDGTQYAESFWIMGVIHLAVNTAVLWVPPIPKGQIGGH